MRRSITRPTPRARFGCWVRVSLRIEFVVSLWVSCSKISQLSFMPGIILDCIYAALLRNAERLPHLLRNSVLPST